MSYPNHCTPLEMNIFKEEKTQWAKNCFQKTPSLRLHLYNVLEMETVCFGQFLWFCKGMKTYILSSESALWLKCQWWTLTCIAAMSRWKQWMQRCKSPIQWTFFGTHVLIKNTWKKQSKSPWNHNWWSGWRMGVFPHCGKSMPSLTSCWNQLPHYTHKFSVSVCQGLFIMPFRSLGDSSKKFPLYS